MCVIFMRICTNGLLDKLMRFLFVCSSILCIAMYDAITSKSITMELKVDNRIFRIKRWLTLTRSAISSSSSLQWQSLCSISTLCRMVRSLYSLSPVNGFHFSFRYSQRHSMWSFRKKGQLSSLHGQENNDSSAINKTQPAYVMSLSTMPLRKVQ